MSTLPTILVLAGLVVLVIWILAARQPDVATYRRHRVVGATPDRVFPLINHLPSWQAWSPWEGLDPKLERTYTGPAAGVGATYAWRGNAKVGEGRMTITQSVPHEQVTLDLVFIKPFAGTMESTFLLMPADAGTRVEWVAVSPMTKLSKVMAVFINMDRMLGAQFEKGLVQLDLATRG